MIRRVLRLVLGAADRAGNRLGSVIGHARLHAQGASVGAGLQLVGAPLVSVARGGRLVLGERVVLCSRSNWTALGVAHPVMLRVLEGAELRIGDDVGMSGGSIVAARSVTLGKRCLLGADVTIADTDFHAVDAVPRRYVADPSLIGSRPVRIGDDVFIGTGAIILKGTTVGDGAVIGAGAVVTRDVPARAIVAGNPARVVRWVGPGAARPGIGELHSVA